jgi:hypothetical protein
VHTAYGTVLGIETSLATCIIGGVEHKVDMIYAGKRTRGIIKHSPGPQQDGP